jgi:arylsulfatase
MDLMPTFIELAGAQYPATFAGKPIPPLEGKSLLPVWRGQPWVGHDYLYWEYNGDRAVRHGDWKIVSLPGKSWQLFDLKTDRAEQHDLTASHPDIAEDLATHWDAWAKKVGADKLKPKKTSTDD